MGMLEREIDFNWIPPSEHPKAREELEALKAEELADDQFGPQVATYAPDAKAQGDVDRAPQP
jgi:hypothetical protein